MAAKISGLFALSIFTIGFLQVSGVIDLRGALLSGSDKYSVYDIPEIATIGIPYSYDFSWMKSLLGPECFEPCHFQTGPMNGFVPMGLVLWPDGILKGIPTGTSSGFEVCVIDAAGKSACRKFNQVVNSPDGAKTATANTTTSGGAAVSTKGLSDVWSGNFTYKIDIESQGNFPFTGKFTLSFNRIGNNIKGSYTTVSEGSSSTENITGTIIGSQIKFNDDWCPKTGLELSICMRFSGTISGNSLSLDAARCSPNNYCPSRGSKGSFNPAIKGTVILTR